MLLGYLIILYQIESGQTIANNNPCWSMLSPDKIDHDVKNDFIREGPMLKRSKFLKEWRKRWVVLTSNYLISFANDKKKEVTDTMDLRTIKNCKSYMAKSEEMIPASFKISSGDTQIYFCASSVPEKWSWIVTLERLCDFKSSGASPYNSLESVAEKGFPSLHEFLDPSSVPEVALSVQKAQLQHVEKYKQNLELEAKILSKEISLEKQQLEKEKSKINELKNIRMSLGNPTANTPSTIDFLQKLQPMGGHKQILIESIFGQFEMDSEDYFAFRYSVEYLVNIVANQRLGYTKIFIHLCRTHANRLNFVKILMECLQEYEPPVLTGEDRQTFSVGQLVKKMGAFQNWLKFIKIVLGSAELDGVQKGRVASKLKGFIMKNESDSTEEMELILEAVKTMHEMVAYRREEIGARLEKIVKMGSKESIVAKAKQLLAALK